jgi:hypothetical protein
MPTARVDTTILVPEFSELPISHLTENLYHRFVFGGYDALVGDRLLSDHIGYPVKILSPFNQLNVRIPELEADATCVSQWLGTLLMRRTK